MSYSKDDKLFLPEESISITTNLIPKSLEQRESRDSYAQEEGGTPQYTDAMYNFIPGSCFEIGFSLTLLDNPGEGGKVIDEYAKQVSAIIETVFNSSLGDQLIQLSPNSNPITLREYFNNKILKELSPASDQIGRCLDESMKDNWFNGGGKDWVQQQLNIDSTSNEHSYKNMLTKIRTISAFGTILRELMPQNKDTIATLIGKDKSIIEGRNNEIITQIRHQDFDTPKTRARTEKMPLVNDEPLGSYKGDVEINLTDAMPKGLGFGNVWHRDEMSYTTQKGKDILDEYKNLETNLGRQGMPRQGQDVQDQNRPGLLGESTYAKIPKPFEDSGLKDQLNSHRFKHGSGINRWQLHGSYAFDSWNQSMPSGGAHSGGTSDIFLAFNCLGEESVFGQGQRVKQTGLLVSSFMNFGGYHSFVETYPIVKSIAENNIFEVQVGTEQRKIYHEMVDTTQKSSPGAYETVQKYFNAYKLTKQEMAKKDDHTFIEMPENRTTEAYVDETISSYRLMTHLMPKQTKVKEDVNVDDTKLVQEEVTNDQSVIVNEEIDKTIEDENNQGTQEKRTITTI